MGEVLTDIVDWMAALSPFWVYGVVLGVAYLENVVPPIPGDMIVVFGGYLASVGNVDLVPVVVLATVGGATGFMTMFAIGHRLGEAVMEPHRFRWLPKAQIAKAEGWLNRYGYPIILANRFLSGARSVISLAAGMSGVRSGPAWVLSAVSALVWTALIAYAGYAVGENWEVIGAYLRTYGAVITGLLVVVVGIQLFRWWWRTKRTRQDSVKNPPRDA